MEKSFINSKKFKVLAVVTSIVAVVCTTLFASSMHDNTDAVNLESPFYSNEMGDNMFTVDGYGDLFVNIIRKSDGTSTGPLAFCLNKQKAFPTNDSILYQSIENDAWTWELDNIRTPSAAQVEAVQRALYAYKYVYPDRMAEFGLESTNTMALYHAEQIAQWAILEDWTSDMVVIKSDVYDKPQMLAYAQNVHRLFSSILDYAKNSSNSSYAEGIKVVLQGTDTVANYTYQSTDYIVTSSGKGYFRSGLMQALPNQKAGYYYEGDYAFTYKVSLEGAPEGTRIVNENGVEQDTFSTKAGVGSNFYIDVPLEAVAGQEGNFTVNVQTTVFRRNAGILWRPLTQTAYQTLLQNASIPENATQSVTLSYAGIAKTSMVQVLKEGEQLYTFSTSETEYGTMYTPNYAVLPLANTKYTIAIVKETDNYFIEAEDGNTYVDGQNLIQNGNVVTGSDGIAQFNKVPLDKNRDTTSYRVTETVPANGYLLGDETSQIVQLDKTTSTSVVSNRALFTNERVNVYFEATKLEEYVSNNDTKAISTRPLEGAVFGIYANETINAADGTSVAKDSLLGTITSGENGELSSASIDLPVGYTFYVKELKTSDALAISSDVYYLDTNITTDENTTDTSIQIALTNANGDEVTEIVNQLKRGNLTIEKRIETMNEDGTSSYTAINDATGFSFDVFADEATTNKIATLTSDNYQNGKFVLENLTPGTYYVKEVSAPANYTIETATKEVSVVALESANVVFRDDLQEITHTLVKYDITSGNREVMAGVTFDVKYNGVIVDSATTKSNGKATFSLKADVTYTLEERVPAGYEKVTEGTITIVGGQNATTEIEVENREIEILGSIKVTKIDGTSNKALENVGFALYRASDTAFEAPLAIDVTNEFGNVTFTGLAPDTYVLVESMPLTGYLPVENRNIDLTGIDNGDVIEVEVENEKFYGNIAITKIDVETREPLSGATLGLFANESITTPIASATSNDDGVVTFENVPYGIYYVGEIEAPKGYELSTTRILVDVTDMTKETVNVTYTNRPINGDLELIKRDTETDEVLEGAVFKLYESENGVRGAYVATLTTNEEGIAKAENIYQREYILEEVSAPSGYVISNEDIVVDASVLTSGQTIRVTAYNAKETVVPAKGSITIHKVDSETKDEIEATFTLLDEAGEIVETKETTNGYVTFEDLALGKYQVIEKVASEGYDVNATVYNITLTDKDIDQTIIVENKKTAVTIEPASIVLTKYDEATDATLEGVVFKVYKKGEEDVYATVTTDENGKATLVNVLNGVYTFVEAQPIEGYDHNDTEYTVEISDLNRYGIISAYNKKTTEPETVVPTTPVKQPVIEIPETGEAGFINPFMIAGCIMVLSAIAGIAYILIKIKKEEA